MQSEAVYVIQGTSNKSLFFQGTTSLRLHIIIYTNILFINILAVRGKLTEKINQ